MNLIFYTFSDDFSEFGRSSCRIVNYHHQRWWLVIFALKGAQLKSIFTTYLIYFTLTFSGRAGCPAFGKSPPENVNEGTPGNKYCLSPISLREAI